MNDTFCPRCNQKLEAPEWRCIRCGITIAPDDPLIGQELGGRHLVLGRLGAGGMAVVYLAVDLEIEGDLIALKILPDEMLNDERAITDLKREVAAARRLSHPNIVRIHDFYRFSKYIYISMEYVTGLTLHELLCRRKSVPLDEVLVLCEPLASAMDYAHEHRVIHRDIKPGNIMTAVQGDELLTVPSTLRVLDFGIARVLLDSQTRTTGGSASGTLSYMSPEQMLGGRLSTRSDIYSLAATIFDLLCGRPPFYSGDLPMQIISKTPPIIPDLPDSVNDALLQGLSKEPGNRPASATALLKLLSRPAGVPVKLPAENVDTVAIKTKSTEVVQPTRKSSKTSFHKVEIIAADGEKFTIEEGLGRLMGMVVVPSQSFSMGTLDGAAAEKPPHQVTLPTFIIDRSPVTNAEFERFIPDHASLRPAWAKGTEGDRMPVVNVTWEEATAYARFRGKRLPTEQEWERAARGQRGLLYPWGNTWMEGKAWAGRDWRVGAKPAGVFPPNDLGIYSTCGNVWEWTSSKFLPYPGSTALPGMDYSQMVARGGAWPQPPRLCRASTRWTLDPKVRDETVGFRCATELPRQNISDVVTS